MTSLKNAFSRHGGIYHTDPLFINPWPFDPLPVGPVPGYKDTPERTCPAHRLR